MCGEGGVRPAMEVPPSQGYFDPRAASKPTLPGRARGTLSGLQKAATSSSRVSSASSKPSSTSAQTYDTMHMVLTS